MRPTPRRYRFLFLTWFVLAVAAGATGLTERMRPPLPQAVLVALTVVLVAAYARGAGFRAWLHAISLRTIVAFHLSRFVGIYFLVLYGRGELPYAFAVPGGWGDIITATGALLLVALVREFARHRALVTAWNTWGLLDIVMVVATATRLLLADPASMRPLLHLPLSLLPTFLVPLIVASHLLVFRRLSLAARAGAAPAAV